MEAQLHLVALISTQDDDRSAEKNYIICNECQLKTIKQYQGERHQEERNKLFEDLAFRNSSKHLNLWPLMLCGNYHGGNKEPEDGQNCMTEYLKNRIWS